MVNSTATALSGNHHSVGCSADMDPHAKQKLPQFNHIHEVAMAGVQVSV